MVKPFSTKEDEFDQNTYSGRFRKFLSLIDPRLMFVGQKDVDEARLKIERRSGSDAELWHARRVIESAVHPQTGELIPAVFRVSAFIATNIPICAGMLFTSPTLFNNIFWQWINQSYNAGFNYCNGNQSKESTKDMSGILKSYAMATGVSVGLSVGLNQWLKSNKTLSPRARGIAQMAVPFVAVASAGVCNVVLMRSQELKTGIKVRTESGEEIGVSKEAAKYVLFKVSLCRVAMAAPILLLPPLAMNMIRSAFTLTPMMTKIAELSVLTVCLGGALPAAVGLFPQDLPVPISILEKEIRDVKLLKDGTNVVYADKGI